ncbi:2-amino-4-hydroxy-6-hydroxymethyldihydropteridine diphosphokinase [Fusobacterium sp.]|uniref:2-amino-4-hydroxy-6- hydroxymethyldihydropteridine diphosphokinase n=1 Tax=Fusobacterium sp. TaxID=68766 RepID=UPI00261DD655|nr:2-amino-4-hydroxy-6-hydroxymethyldihydropteridine diphosphokinase [Fusobacterium sp.]
MDKIIIENLEIIAEHGVFKEEKFLGQKFIISIEMLTDTREAGKTENLEASTHYGFVADDIEKLFTSKSFDLIETCAEKIAEMILTKYHLISEVKVTVKKPWAPIRKHFDFVAVEITRKWHTAYLSLGSNMGDKKKNLLDAIEKIDNLENTKVTSKSTILETEPFGYTEQDWFLNACIEIKTLFTPQELLEKLLSIELYMGRERIIKWGPRIIDLDILFFDNEIIQDKNLCVPHPWICERMFVLEPLCEIAPNLVHPLERKPISTLKRMLERELEK